MVYLQTALGNEYIKSVLTLQKCPKSNNKCLNCRHHRSSFHSKHSPHFEFFGSPLHLVAVNNICLDVESVKFWTDKARSYVLRINWREHVRMKIAMKSMFWLNSVVIIPMICGRRGIWVWVTLMGGTGYPGAGQPGHYRSSGSARNCPLPFCAGNGAIRAH